MRKWVSGFFIFLACSTTVAAESSANLEPIEPIPQQVTGLNADKLLLGAQLFMDQRLSKDETVSCASCHQLSGSGADHRIRSIGAHGHTGEINTPTVFNSALNFRLFWNGRAKSLEEQMDGPFLGTNEMGSNWAEIISKISKDPKYANPFRQLYPEGVTRQNIENAIATFERGLITPNAKIDRFLRGDSSALTATEKLGYQRFKTLGCVSCHQGINIGGNMFQTMGIMGDYFKDRGTPITNADLGLYTFTGKDSDKFVFRVPSLRNVALSAPYFHDGSAATLEQAVSTMAKYQLGRHLSKEEIASIVAFLKTLTGEKPPIVDQVINGKIK